MDNIIEDNILPLDEDDIDGAYQYPDVLAHNLRAIREYRGLTHKTLATNIGAKASTIRNYETGTYIPTLETIEVLAEGLDVPIEALLSMKIYRGEESSRSVTVCGVKFFT